MINKNKTERIARQPVIRHALKTVFDALLKAAHTVGIAQKFGSGSVQSDHTANPESGVDTSLAAATNAKDVVAAP